MDNISTNNNILTYKIDTEQPIDIEELAESLIAIQNIYKKNIFNNEISIQLNEIRKGSYEFDFVVQGLALALPFIENCNSAIEFIKNCKIIFSYFKNYSSQTDKNLFSNEDVVNFSNTLKPIININGGNPTIYFLAASNGIKEEISISKDDAVSISHNIDSFINSKLNNKNQEIIAKNEIFEDKLVELVQTRIDNKKGNKMLCKDIYKKEVDVDFANEYLKKQILENNNPHLHFYQVNLEVSYENDIPKTYKIISIKNIFNKSESLFE
ncbi:hypothetical protein FO198_06440 [Campylobacter coli]|nr:hypothetical protein [Campylobacter coli]